MCHTPPRFYTGRKTRRVQSHDVIEYAKVRHFYNAGLYSMILWAVFIIVVSLPLGGIFEVVSLPLKYTNESDAE